MITKILRKVPAGTLLVPMLVLSLIHTFFPAWLDSALIRYTFGSAGTYTVLGICLVTAGAQLKLRELLRVLRRGGVLLLAKFLIGSALGILVGKCFGMQGIFGISSLAIICAVTSTNGGLYYALAQDLGDEVDAAAVGILAVSNGPFLTMLALGASGLTSFDLKSILAMVLPLLIGMILGNLDPTFAEFLSSATPVLTFFLGCVLGAGIDLKNVLLGGLSGILLGLITLFISGPFVVLCDRFLNRRPGYAGWAASATAGNAVAVPAAVALADTTLDPLVANATAQVAAAVILTAVLVPLIAAWWGRKYGCPKHPKNT